MVAHGLLAALTFALSGYIANQINSTKIADMGGLLRAMPYIGAVMIMAMIAGCGLPGFASFPGEALVLFGSWSKFQLITGLAIWGALVIAGVYMLRAIRNVWHGDRAMDRRLGCEKSLAQNALRPASCRLDYFRLLPAPC